MRPDRGAGADRPGRVVAVAVAVLPPAAPVRHAHHRHGPSLPPLVARGAPEPVDWDRVVARSFLASAAFYAAGSAVLLFPPIRALSTDLATREGALTHLGMTIAAAGLFLGAGLGYRLPAGLGRRLWSIPLAWLHFAVLHAAYLAAATGFYCYHAAQDALWLLWLGWGGAASAAGLVAMAGNLYGSLREAGAPGEGERP